MNKWSKSLFLYFILAYLISWTVLVLLALNHHGLLYLFPDDADHARTEDLWHSFAALGPALGAWIVFRIFYKNHGIIKSYSAKGIPFSGWVLAFSPFLYFALAVVIAAAATGEWFSLSGFFRENQLLKPVHLSAWLLPAFAFGIFEEIGWRGFALPALQARYSAWMASTILTVFWAGWHIPSFFYRFEFSGPMLIGFVLGIYAGALYLTYLFNYTRGSLLVVSIWHVSWDLVSRMGKENILAPVMSAMIMVLAAFVVIKYKGRNLSPSEKIVLQD